MFGDCKRQLLFLLSILFLLLIKCECNDMKVYKCTNESNVCGCSKRASIGLKIKGGESSLFSNWDWMVSMRLENEHLCGGSILNQWFIITTAHCFDNITNITSDLTICSGTFRLSDSCHQRRIINSFIIHPDYNETTNENDLALIRLQTPLDLSDSSITPICLPDQNFSSDENLPEGTQVVSLGWGNLQTNQTADVLQQVQLRIMDSSSIFCNHILNEKVQLCAGGIGKGISKGDSGGPLMFLSPSKQWQLIGLASFIKQYPTMFSGSGYTSIIPFIKYIQQQIRKTSIDKNSINCSCQCPQGNHFQYAFTQIDSLDGCLDACIKLDSNLCTSSNTYACIDMDCTYSKSYNISTIRSTQDQNSSILDSVLMLSNGDKYQGQTKDGKKHGHGTYTWINGDKYQGDWIENKRTGKGIYSWPSGTEYQGEFLDGKLHGKGTYMTSDGHIYIGDWFQSSRTGKGRLIWSDGDEYTGDWINGYRTGKGVYTSTLGDKYVGDWIDNIRTGKGVLTDSDGDRYVGDWIDNYKTGKGIYTWANGDKYIGDWIENKRTGIGILILSDEEKYEGQFKDGEKHGQGTYTLTNGNTYVGEWIKGSITGQGTYKWLNGDKYIGHFEDGQINGQGTMHYQNGTIKKGIWPNGPFV